MAVRTSLALVSLANAAAALAQAPPPAGFPGTPPPSPPVVIRELAAEPAALEPGQATTLRWEVLNAYSLALEPGVGTVPTRGTRRPLRRFTHSPPPARTARPRAR
jgi:hypothetical protein